LTKEHLHLATLLAIPFAVAVHRAQLYEWAQIYAHERKELIRKLMRAGSIKGGGLRDSPVARPF
jgi:GAF domain-containing protein